MPFKNSALRYNQIITAHMRDFFGDLSYYASLRAIRIASTIGLIYVWIFYIPDPKKEMSALFSGANIVLSVSGILSK